VYAPAVSVAPSGSPVNVPFTGSLPSLSMLTTSAGDRDRTSHDHLLAVAFRLDVDGVP